MSREERQEKREQGQRQETLHLYTEKAAAAELGLPVGTLIRWRLQRRIRFLRVGRSVRYTRAQIEAFIAEHTAAVDQAEDATYPGGCKDRCRQERRE